ncbi:hypothetical protein ANN_04931 [Periplaneta americana]|uniref:Peptidase A1 domain-containing protein n=1 Tax=Periplaneta americana TaxID=6978 RepID=A0ABQ8T9S5_PERAM|nr:hypothetical protein ANN_04931 [Periplaneta americana]
MSACGLCLTLILALGATEGLIRVPLTRVQKGQSLQARDGTNVALTNVNNIMYLAEILVGAQQQPFKVQVDTGSSNLFIPSPNSDSCGTFNNFQCQNYVSNEDITLKYGSNAVQGPECEDTVTIGGIPVQNQYFTVVDSCNASLQGGLEGIMGVGFSSTAENFVSLYGETVQPAPVLVNIFNQQPDQEQVFSLYLSKLYGDKLKINGQMFDVEFCLENLNHKELGTMKEEIRNIIAKHTMGELFQKLEGGEVIIQERIASDGMNQSASNMNQEERPATRGMHSSATAADEDVNKQLKKKQETCTEIMMTTSVRQGRTEGRHTGARTVKRVVVITEDVQNVHLLLEYRPHIDVSLTCELDPKLQEYCVCPQNMPQFDSEGISNQAPETNKPMILNGPTSRNREGSDQEVCVRLPRKSVYKYMVSNLPITNDTGPHVEGEPHLVMRWNSCTDDSQGQSELTIGGIDPKHYTGNLVFADLVPNSFSLVQQWQVNIQGFSVGGKDVGECGISSCTVVIDSGTSLITIPYQEYDALIYALQTMTQDISNLQPIVVTIQGQQFVINPADYTTRRHKQATLQPF